MNFAEDIKKFLKDNPNFNRHRLARAAGIDPVILTRLLNGQQKGVHLNTYLKLAPIIYNKQQAPGKE